MLHGFGFSGTYFFQGKINGPINFRKKHKNKSALSSMLGVKQTIQSMGQTIGVWIQNHENLLFFFSLFFFAYIYIYFPV